MAQRILIADDDEAVVSALSMFLDSEGFSCVTVGSPEHLIAAIRRQDFDLVLMDLNYSLDTTSGEEGLALISRVRQLDEVVPIVVMTGWATVEVAVNTMKNGANDFVQKPWENDRLLAIIKNQTRFAGIQRQSERVSRQNEILREEISPATDIVCGSEAIKRVLATVEQVAESDVSVLFTGENGTGKSLFARHLHELSARRESALVAVNMGAVTESLFESEMFGHVKGAFTDAKSTRIGRFELADEGTLFLDEIGNTPYSQQGKLLRVLEDGRFERVGSQKTQTVDIRLLTATNCDLKEAVREGRFRKDLLYRINTVTIDIPPLRHRVSDILPLANAFLWQASIKNARPIKQISAAAESVLKSYSWPGNVRELGHVMERSLILSRGPSIQTHDLGLDADGPGEAVPAAAPCNPDEDLRPISVIEADVIERRLVHFNGDAAKAAKSLGLSRSAFYRRLGKSTD